jgi:hypothetical protein
MQASRREICEGRAADCRASFTRKKQIFFKHNQHPIYMQPEDFTEIQTYLTYKDPSTNQTKYAYIITKILTALSKSTGHLPPEFFAHTGFNKSRFFMGNNLNFTKDVDETLANAAEVVMHYLQTQNDLDKLNAQRAMDWLISAFGPALEPLFNPKSKFLPGFHIHPQTIPSFTIFAAEREQLLPILIAMRNQL